jgi:hypothetical protein
MQLRRPCRGRLLRIDLHTGTAGIVNAGHPLPLRLRGGVVEEIKFRVEVPFGVLPGKTFDVQPFPLQPGDRILFLTDGMLERSAALDVAAALADTADLHPREVVHALGAAALRATGGHLRDDATMLCLDWYGGPPASGTPSRAPTPAAPRRAPDRGVGTLPPPGQGPGCGRGRWGSAAPADTDHLRHDGPVRVVSSR